MCNQLSGQLTQIFVNEIQKHVLPVVGARLDGIKAQIQAEIAQKLSITDKVIKENIANICKSKVRFQKRATADVVRKKIFIIRFFSL